MQNKPNKRSQMEVWEDIQRPEMLLNQRFWFFYWNIVYTRFYSTVQTVGIAVFLLV